MRDLAFTLLYAFISAFAITRPWLGMFIWSWMDYMNPHRLCYSYAKYSIPFSLIASLLTFGSFFISSEPKRFVWTRETILLICFAAWMNVTVWFALNPSEAWVEWDRVMKIQIMVFATFLLIWDRWRLDGLIWTIAVSIGFYGVKGGIFTIVTGGNDRVHGPEYTYIQDNNDLALALVAVIPMMRYLQLRSGNKWIRFGLSAAMLLCTVAVLGSYSRGGMVALVTVMILMVMKSRKRVLFGLLLIVAITLALKVMPQQWFDRMNSIKQYQQDNSALGRFNAWSFAWNVASHHPLTGGGFRVFTKSNFEIYAPDPTDFHEAHNIFFKVLGEHGFPGVILFILLWVTSWGSARWIRKATRGDPDLLWASDLASMLQVSLAGYMLGGSFLNLAYFALPYHLMAIVVICKVLVKQELWSVQMDETTEDDALELEASPVTA
jgi:probable O-glycosylation ligase (exosortase A-associated)